MTENVYVVERTEDRERRSRFVLIAENATKAAEQVALTEGVSPDELEVGMLGTYDPGITGAAMSRGAYVAIQRIGQRS